MDRVSGLWDHSDRHSPRREVYYPLGEQRKRGLGKAERYPPPTPGSQAHRPPLLQGH